MKTLEKIKSNWWKKVDHNSSEQLKRQKSAIDKKLTPISIDKNKLLGEFEGSTRNYIVTLDYCECSDFNIRKNKYPCKHIYRLAHELGVFDLSNNGENTISVGSLKKDVPLTIEQIIKYLPKGEAKYLKYLLNQVLVQKKGTFYHIDSFIPITSLIKYNLIIEAQETPETALSFYKINEIKEMFKDKNLTVPTSSRWKIIGPLAIEQIGDLLLENLHKKTTSKYYEINPIFEPIWSKLYYTLTKMYPGEYISAVDWAMGNLLAGNSKSLYDYILKYLEDEYNASEAKIIFEYALKKYKNTVMDENEDA